MGIYSKTAFAVLALALSCTPLLAQDAPADPLPAHQGARRMGHVAARWARATTKADGAIGTEALAAEDTGIPASRAC